MLSKFIPGLACFLAVGACRTAPSAEGLEPKPPVSAAPTSASAGGAAYDPSPIPTAEAAAAAPETSAARAEPTAEVPLARRPGPRHLLVVGDSLSDLRSGGGGYLRHLSQACPSLRIDNRAKGGFMVNQMRRRFEAELNAAALRRYTDVVVFGGVNDLYSDETAARTVEKICRDLQTMYERARVAGARVIALTVAPWGGYSRYYNPRRAQATERLNAWIAEQRARGLVDVVLETQPVLTCGDTERLCPEYEPPFKDGLHFGRLGHERLGQALIDKAFPECASNP